ncbi:MAG TPA: hypothetical protein VIT88_01295 [Pyrinomonadaceae bacterium]
MRTLILFITGLITAIAAAAQTPMVGNGAQPSQHLEVHLISEKLIYKRGDEITLKASVKNASDQDIFIYGNLEWGHLASLTLSLKDAKGRSIQPKFISDAITYVPDDKSYFVRLSPFHFLGTSYIASTEELNIRTPGRYSIFIEYRSPISSSKAEVSPFYGKEKGVIQSNTVFIEVR